MKAPRLLLLTDRTQLPPGRSLLDTVATCVEAGLAAVVVREHDLPPPERSALVAMLAGIPGLTVISSRIPDPAAHGVHLSAAQSGPGTGRSCHSREEVRRAAAEGATYATLSPYAVSPSKPGYGPPQPPDAFAGHPIPVYALGGIEPGNAAEARAAGAYGVAVMGALMRADDPAAVVGSLLEAVG